jgi:hypothetical protein
MARALIQAALALALAGLAFDASLAAEFEAAPRAFVRPYVVLPPERHVIEVVDHAYGQRFVINGARFAAKVPACFGWVAGDRIQFLSGEIHGFCVDAVIYNVTRRASCEMWCGGPARWYSQ